ncbi:MAG: sodium:proton antiporter [Tagaea sp.]|nr:sodium:proton antiporter [Tagaea sp.]
MFRPLACLAVFALVFAVDPAFAAAEGAPKADGKAMSLIWILPFVAILAGIALGPLFFAKLWHHHYGKFSVGCAFAFLIPCALVFGPDVALYEFLHTMTIEYIPFIVLLFSLYVVAGGVRFTGELVGTPAVNTAVLAFGTAIASVMGTVGASMLLIHVMIRANAWRKNKTHVFVFFIFLVSNIGGSLTPLGDPPLFIGFLEGVDFFWPTKWMFFPMLLVALPLLAIFYVLDSWFARREASKPPESGPLDLGLEGKVNLLLLAGVVGAVLMSGAVRWGTVDIYHTPVPVESLARSAILLALAGLSLKLTAWDSRVANGFSWEPMKEVAKLFIGIFVCIIPAIAIIRAGTDGALAGLIALLNADGQPNNVMYFWITGILSSFLDNAPTYLLFFNLAGGDEQALMGPLAYTLLAISMGAVFMGANTYIGNAPNFMVKAVCEEKGIKMPSFFGYMGWACVFLLPLFVVATFVFFRA